MTLCRGRGLVFFYPLRGANPETSHDLQPGAHQGSCSSQIFFTAQYLKSYYKSSPFGAFETEQPKLYQNCIFNP